MQDFSRPSVKTDILFFGVSVLVSFGVYLRTLCPTVYVGDSGELIAAAYTLGIPHPPGYPLFCLLGKLFTFLPVGNIAYRVNLLSATFASLTVGFVFLVLSCLLRRVRPEGNRAVAAAGALFYGFLRDFWNQAVSAEVYTLNAFFTALLFYLLLRWQAEKKEPLLLWSFFFWGLGLGNHHTLLIFGPLFLVMMLLEEPALFKKRRFLGKALGYFLLGLSVYLYLPLRAMQSSDTNWGVTLSWKSVVDHIVRRRYLEIGSAPRSVALYLHELLSFFETWRKQAPIFFWIFSLWGFWKLFLKHPREWFLATFLFLESTAFLILAVNFEGSSSHCYIMRPFYLPAWMILVFFWGVGVSEAMVLVRKNSFPRVARLGIFLFPMVLFYSNFPLNDLSRSRTAESFGRDTLDTIEPNGKISASGDNALFILAYLKKVEHLRSDVQVSGLQVGPFPELSEETLARSLSRFPETAVYSNSRSPLSLPGYAWKPTGLLYRLVREGEGAPSISWKAYRIQQPETVRTDDLFEKSLLSRYLAMKGEGLLAAGKEKEARELFEKISVLAGEEGALHLQLGTSYLAKGWAKEALTSYQKALRLNPYDPEVWKGLGITLGQLGYYRESIKYLLRASQRRTRDPDITFNLGVSYGNLKRFEEALFWWRKTLFLDPSRPFVKDHIRKAKRLSDEENT